jgi:hypothetical protein
MLKNLNDSSDDSDNYSNEVADIKEDNEDAESDGKLQKVQAKNEDDYSQDEDEDNNDGYDSTPSGMKKNRQNDDLSKDEDDSENEDEDEQVLATDAVEQEEEIDEDEMIDVAEKIFIRMSQALIENGVSVRSAFDRHIQIAEINGQPFELIAPMGFLEGIKELGLDDLRQIEVTYLLKVLSKSELDGAIMLDELLQIMENFGLYDKDAEN